MIQSYLGRLSAGESLTLDEMAGVMDLIMQGGVAEPQIALLLTALSAKGETVDEIAGAATALRKHMTPIRTRHVNVVDTCGTGGGGGGTFNISTAAALVAAGAGAVVAKHGNRRITSKSGSADVLEQLGVNITAGVERVERCLDEVGVCFCFAPQLHPAMKHVAKVRRELGRPTIFNLLGPLCNPAGAPYQVLGVGKPELRPLLAAALGRLGVKRAVVVSGADGLGEITLSDVTHVTEIGPGQTNEFEWSPEDFGVQRADRSEILASDPEESAAIIRRILAGEKGPPRDIVVVNAAAALWIGGWAPSPAEGATMAEAAIDERKAANVLDRLVTVLRN